MYYCFTGSLHCHTDPLSLDVRLTCLQADVEAVCSSHKLLKETQELILRTQQQLLHRMKRLENMTHGRHHLQYAGRQQDDNLKASCMTPVAPTPSISLLHTPTPPSCRSSLQHTLTATSSPAVTLDNPYTPSVPSSPAPYYSVGVGSAPSMTTPARPVCDDGAHQPPMCPRLIHRQPDRCLPSESVTSPQLLPAVEVMAKYPKLLVANKVPTLAVKLARESFFGEELMAQCTVMGCRGYPGLPYDKLCSLKETIFKRFPGYWSNAAEFQTVWVSCTDAIRQACKRFRHKNT